MRIISLFLFLSLHLGGFSQKKSQKVSLDTLPAIELQDTPNNAFAPGEYLRFRLHYGIIDAGEAELTVKDAPRSFFGRPAYHIVGTGQTLGAFNWFFKVRDRYETYLDANGVFPWVFIRNIEEGSYTKHQTYRFFQHKAAVQTHKGETFSILPFSQDMLSSFYYARTLDFTHAKVGDVFTIPAFVDDEKYPVKIKFMGREELKSRTGTYRCLKFVPVVQEGRIFEEEEDLTVWISDDKNKVPILAKAKVLVGSIKMELVEYANLVNPIAKVD